MKFGKFDRKPIEGGHSTRGQNRPSDPNSIENRCKREGVKTHPRTIRSRMTQHDLTFEEAVAYKPQNSSMSGRKGKKGSYWNKTTPNSPEDHREAEGGRKKLLSKHSSLRQVTDANS